MFVNTMEDFERPGSSVLCKLQVPDVRASNFLWVREDTEAQPVAFTRCGHSEEGWGPTCMQF